MKEDKYGKVSLHLDSFLTIATAKQKSDRRSEFALANLFGHFDVGGVELPVTVGFQRPKEKAEPFSARF